MLPFISMCPVLVGDTETEGAELNPGPMKNSHTSAGQNFMPKRFFL